MDSIILEFESKVEEIEEYFSFIRTTTSLEREPDETRTVIVSMTVFNVLKANLFLLLYNLIEASFRDSLENICINITDNCLKYKNVISEIKKLWITKKYKNFEQQCSIPRDISKAEFMMDKIDTIAEDIISVNYNNQLSGNVTPNVIKESIDEYGLSINDSDIEKSALFIIKNKRNNLAHGNETFSECGSRYTTQRLEDIKNESIEYMRFILENIQSFIINQEYKSGTQNDQ